MTTTRRNSSTEDGSLAVKIPAPGWSSHRILEKSMEEICAVRAGITVAGTLTDGARIAMAGVVNFN